MRGSHKLKRRNIPFARQLRVEATDAEARLWQRLRNRMLGGFKFRRQFPVGPYIADFVCIERKLIVELDGGQHADNPADERRTRFLELRGYRVIRFWNPDVLSNTDGVLEMILLELERPLTLPPSDDGSLPLPNGERDKKGASVIPSPLGEREGARRREAAVGRVRGSRNENPHRRFPLSLRCLAAPPPPGITPPFVTVQ